MTALIKRTIEITIAAEGATGAEAVEEIVKMANEIAANLPTGAKVERVSDGRVILWQVARNQVVTF